MTIFFRISNLNKLRAKINYIYLRELSNSGNKMARKKFTQINPVKSV